ncbi:MAG: hypothetical protein E7068_07195 [Lentimicrobiaceae bacterium]|nr:hypothetical protein [Lentimicrobiaceae bacterium]
MDFLYPNMLYALIALIIPIVVHLFNFRRHKLVYFSNTSILKTIEQENSKTKKLKYIITLIMRMLFLASIVVAFAFPYKKDNNTINNNVDNLIAIYIDNSMSMQSHSSEKTLFEDSRTSAMKLVENLNQAQKYVLLSNDRNPENEYPMNKDEMLQRLNEMKTEAPSTSIDDIYNSLAFIKKKNDFNSATLFVYSDFQNNTMASDDFKVDTTIQIVAFPLKSDFQNNIYIDSVWLQSPVLQKNMTNELNARIVNETANDIKGLPVNFSIDENVVAYTTCDIKADSYADVNMQFAVENEGDSKAKVAINDSPITFDDEYNLVLKVRPEINVVEIQSTVETNGRTSNNSLSLLFDGDALINYQSMNKYNIDQSIINNAQMIVVDNTELNETMQKSLIEFAEQGGTLLMIESQGQNVAESQSYNAYIYNHLGIKPIDFDDNETKLEYIAKRNSFFDDIFVELPDNADLPKVKKHVRFKIGKNVQNIISLQNGDPLLMMSNVGKGKIFVMSTSFDEEYSDLANHALFVPLMYKMALIGGNISELSFTLGVDKTLNINDVSLNVDDRISLKSDNAMYEIFPMIENRNGTNYISFFEDLPSSGFYDIYKNEEYIKTVAWNDNRSESEMSFYDKEELSELLKDNNLNVLMMVSPVEAHGRVSDDVVENIVNQSSLWKIFVIIALISLLIEILILRFWK